MADDRSMSEIVFQAHAGTVYPLKLICSGERPSLITCGEGGSSSIARWDPLTGEKLCAYDNRWRVSDFLVIDEEDPRGRILAATQDGISSWDLRDGGRSVGFSSPSADEFHMLSPGSFSDGTRFVAASCREGIYFVDPLSGQPLRPFLAFGLGDCTSVLTLAPSPGLCLVAAGGDNGYVRVWSADNQELLHQFEGNFESLIASMAVNYLDDGSTILTCGDIDGVIYRWNISTGAQFGSAIASSDLITNIVSIDSGPNHLLIVSGQDGAVHQWNCLTGEMAADLIDGVVVDAAIAPGGSLLIAVGRYDGNVAVSRLRLNVD